MEFDRRGGWSAVGIRSCAHWLAWQCGLSPGAAREHVRVARALTGLPATAASFTAGRLSVGTAPTGSITRLLLPDRAPDLPDAMHVNGERVDLAYVVGVLLGNCDPERRLAAGNAGDAGRLVAVA
ncbi:DUF222 domain-containing protein [Geodermatophilus sp. DF01_2]|uniref:DUF222 domain-containing protein n=1 Tax=Geodermatophilus sp. DF01-2 TaxID=2559610 RepID=UPI001ADDBE51|nr:DUF222 domain-containing protein [Geodermatophilus sp. DF01_2]